MLVSIIVRSIRYSNAIVLLYFLFNQSSILLNQFIILDLMMVSNSNIIVPITFVFC